MPDGAGKMDRIQAPAKGVLKQKKNYFGNFFKCSVYKKYVCAPTFTRNTHNPVTTTEDIEPSVILQ